MDGESGKNNNPLSNSATLAEKVLESAAHTANLRRHNSVAINRQIADIGSTHLFPHRMRTYPLV